MIARAEWHGDRTSKRALSSTVDCQIACNVASLITLLPHLGGLQSKHTLPLNGRRRRRNNAVDFNTKRLWGDGYIAYAHASPHDVARVV